ncbi:type I-E CRISPR-associated protein Cse1/CasA [Thermus sp.]|uniref:type I-E CRISPR-associated protein Cse1/CasA n=1 Tax=Thermus sp. TaxID=275 RepID=UPI003D1510E4
MEPKFNLVEEPWIPVLKEGRVVEVGMGEALLRAHELTRIETPSPLEEAALYRLLLAALHRALMGPRRLEDVLDWWRAGRFPEGPIRDYLDRFRDRFFLFHPEAPFFQVADLPEENPLPWSKLLPELASGNNPTLFDHTTEENLPKATYAQAARALLVHQAFALGGLLRRFGVGSAKDAPVARPALFLPTGGNLLETLLLNLVPYAPEEDAPIWEVPPLRLADLEGGKARWPLSGRTRVYTWPARGVRLLDEGDGVRFMGYGPGVEPREALHRDPMVAQRLDGKGNFLVLRLSEERSFWRDFSAMLPRQGGKVAATLEHADNLQGELEDALPSGKHPEEAKEARVALRVLGQVTDQAKVLDLRREVYPLPPGLLCPEGEANLEKALKEAEELGQGLRGLAFKVARAVVGERDSNFARSLPLERLYWHALDGAFPGFLARVAEEASLKGWREELKRAAREAWVATRLFLGTGARHLKALAQGEQEFGRLLGALGKEVGT